MRLVDIVLYLRISLLFLHNSQQQTLASWRWLNGLNDFFFNVWNFRTLEWKVNAGKHFSAFTLAGLKLSEPPSKWRKIFLMLRLLYRLATFCLLFRQRISFPPSTSHSQLTTLGYARQFLMDCVVNICRLFGLPFFFQADFNWGKQPPVLFVFMNFDETL